MTTETLKVVGQDGTGDWTKSSPLANFWCLKKKKDLKTDKTGFKGKKEQVSDVCETHHVW